ncbi:MAG: TRAP transporter substrate-binding protein [Deltaproteobacteria bacterium]|jgi:TRAP-type C4-dicarboxylate transport system substrate-binding protein|nr:TRAP transporter substrate-binding protein [Deltaproteobacteria bacterium]
MKKISVLALALIFALAGQALAAAEFTLTLNLPIPPIHTRWAKALKPWADEISRRSQGRLEIEPYFAEALSPRSETYESVRSGIADLTEGGFEANTGQFPWHEGILSISNPGRAMLNPMPLLQSMQAKYPEALKEIAGVRLLFCHASPDLIIGTKSRPVRKLTDLKGMKIQANSALIAERLKKLGVSVVSMPISDVYTALESGVIDGTTLDFELLVARRFGDQVKHMTALSLQNTLFYVIINEGVYRSLPPELQKILDDVSGKFAEDLFSTYWSESETAAVASWLNNMGGKEMIILSDADYAQADKLMRPVVEDWFERLNKSGLPGKAMKKLRDDLVGTLSVPWKDSPLYRRYLDVRQ